jgi:Phosphotransferase enzyme family
MLMTNSASQFPDQEALTASLNSILNGDGTNRGEVTILNREMMEEGSFPKERITCQIGSVDHLQIFCKYTGGYSHASHGHRGGVPYEAAVYRDLLQPLQVATPTFYGSQFSQTDGDVWMFLEYLPDTLRLNQPEDPEAAMNLAARWLGKFHALVESHLPLPDTISEYTAEYYRGWSRRTQQFARDSQVSRPWLESLCLKFDDTAPLILGKTLTVIHGEFYPRNILYRDDNIYPVDWESAAIAAGEIDLVTMTDCWPEEVFQDCTLEYRQARWPTGAPPDFDETLTWARLYLQLRWLGDCGRAGWWCANCQKTQPHPHQPGLALDQDSLWRFEQLQDMGERLRLI